MGSMASALGRGGRPCAAIRSRAGRSIVTLRGCAAGTIAEAAAAAEGASTPATDCSRVLIPCIALRVNPLFG